MKKILLLLFLGLVFISCSKPVTGEGSADIAQDYEVGNFTKINAKGMFKLMLVNSDSSYVSVQTHRNLIENMDISTSGSTLNISEKNEVAGFESYEVYVYYAQPIEKIELGGKVLAELGGTLMGDKLDIQAKGGSGIEEFNIVVKELNIDAKEKTSITLTGESTKANVTAVDLASVDLSQLKTVVATVDLENEAELKINVENELNGEVLNNSSLEYWGNPKKDVDVKDRGKIQNK